MTQVLNKHEVVVVGLDPSLRNLGMVKVVVHKTERRVLRVLDMKLVKTAKDQTKGVIQNHDRLRRGREILQEMRAFCYGATFACAEIPEGAQDAQAAWAMGITIGIICACSIPVVEVRPRNVKLITGGLSTASKEEMRQWAYAKYPDATWLTTKRGGKMVPVNDNEHLADALAILEAGIIDDKAKGLLGAWTTKELLAMPIEPVAPRRKFKIQLPRRRLDLGFAL
jgi:Holliday junction resolvasome RuvABC endonuclease subunit